ncbi:MAG: cardiolipin synthase, partial [Gammaproteobacteria bacterium]|nr:cardiolipin synthase [Gammaproteobacteria bacterium]NNC96476.1 cardiolipin synthase [Gammaproteobacteria bacterium]
RIIYRRLPTSTSTAWILVIAALPILGLFFYIFFGDQKLSRRRARLGRKVNAFYQEMFDIADRDEDLKRIEPDSLYAKIAPLISQDTGFYPSRGNRIEHLTDVSDISRAMLNDIEQAERSCHMEFFIIRPYGLIADILNAVLDAAARGVDCRILADDIGSSDFFKSDWIQTLRDGGVKVERSLKTGFIRSLSERADLRNHRKLMVIDQDVAYTGSFNLIDPSYQGADADTRNWVDVILRLEGNIVLSLACVFNKDYLLDSQNAADEFVSLQDLPLDERDSTQTDAMLQLIPSGPEMQHSLIYEVLLAAFFNAKQSIYIVTPYFVPDEALILAVTNAARRGLDVTLILPSSIDSHLARYAGQSEFGKLLRSGVNITLFREGMLHTKAVIIDGELGFIGTVNMDQRSFYLNLEVTLAIADNEFLNAFSTVIKDYLEQSDRLDKERWAQRSPGTRLLENLCRLVGPML